MSLDTSPKLFCFVIMPFRDEFRDVYDLAIKEACLQAGSYCERIDEQVFHDSILQRLYNQISKADVIIADMSGRSENVFYEVGYAHALGKPTILLTADEEDIPFDLKHFPHIVYGSSLSTLKSELQQRVKWYVDNHQTTPTSANIEVDLFIGSESLSSGTVRYRCPNDQYPRPTISVVNQSLRSYPPGEIKLGILGSDLKRVRSNLSLSSAILPTGQKIYMIHDLGNFHPQETIGIDLTIGQRPEDVPDDLTFRIFTSVGTRDYPLRIVIDE